MEVRRSFPVSGCRHAVKQKLDARFLHFPIQNDLKPFRIENIIPAPALRISSTNSSKSPWKDTGSPPVEGSLVKYRIRGLTSMVTGAPPSALIRSIKGVGAVSRGGKRRTRSGPSTADDDDIIGTNGQILFLSIYVTNLSSAPAGHIDMNL